MNNILIILDGFLAKHFLERLCLQKGLKHHFTVLYYNEESVNLAIKSDYIEFVKFDPTSLPKMQRVIKGEFSQAFIYMQDEFDTKKTYENLRILDKKLDIVIMDFWGLPINDEHCDLVDSKATLSQRLLDFLPDVALTAQFIGLGIGEIMEIKIPAGSAFAYRHIGSIAQKKWRIVLIYRNNKMFFVKPSFMLQPNDSILIVGDPSVLQGVYHNVKKDKGQFPSPFGSNIYCFLDMKEMSETIQEKLLQTCFYLHSKINNKKLFIEIFNPTLCKIYEDLKNLSLENVNIYFNYTQSKKEDFKDYFTHNNIGLFVLEKSFFEKNKKVLYDFKVPLLKVGIGKMEDLKEATILSSGQSEIEAQSNVIMDLSAQLDLGVKLYHYDPTNSDESAFVLEYFQSLAKLYNKKIQIIQAKDENPILQMKSFDALHFISFNEQLTSNNFGKSFSMDLNRLYYKMDQNYQLFIPVE